jgi:hypothetical protein
VTDLLARVRDVFLEPPAEPRVIRQSTPTVRPAERCALLGPSDCLAAEAAHLALSALSGSGAHCALVATWGATGSQLSLPSAPRAASAGAAMRARGIPATTSGRLVRLDLPHEPGDARSALSRAAAVLDGPAVLAVGRGRTDEVDRILAEQDVIVVLEARSTEKAARELALESLRALGPPVVTRTPAGRARRLLASSGWAYVLPRRASLAVGRPG